MNVGTLYEMAVGLSTGAAQLAATALTQEAGLPLELRRALSIALLANHWNKGARSADRREQMSDVEAAQAFVQACRAACLPGGDSDPLQRSTISMNDPKHVNPSKQPGFQEASGGDRGEAGSRNIEQSREIGQDDPSEGSRMGKEAQKKTGFPGSESRGTQAAQEADGQVVPDEPPPPGPEGKSDD